jgi:GDP-L-fucose synthase
MGEKIFLKSKVLVAGGTGLIGTALVKQLIELGALVKIVSLDVPSRANPETEFIQADLRYFDVCLRVCEGMDYVFNLLCVKGSPKLTGKKPASLFVPTLMFNTALAEAARVQKIKAYLYTSSVAVYPQSEILKEDEVWDQWPSENDQPAGWAKRMGELQLEYYKNEYGWASTVVVRPSNVYGPYDNFDSPNAAIIPSLIRGFVRMENPLIISGNGFQIRDFIYASDVARGMIIAIQNSNNISGPINLGSGRGATIRDLIAVISDNCASRPKIIYDMTLPSGDKKRVMDISKARTLGFGPEISLEEGIKATMDWYRKNSYKTKAVNDFFK